jgi:hypothetical protein
VAEPLFGFYRLIKFLDGHGCWSPARPVR